MQSVYVLRRLAGWLLTTTITLGVSAALLAIDVIDIELGQIPRRVLFG